jgi:transaldolase
MAVNALEQLRHHTIVVADTGDFGELEKYQPRDSTTNPTLLYQASQLPRYRHLLTDAVEYAKGQLGGDADVDRLVELTCDRLAVNFGCEILKIIPGRVSTEIDARLSYDTQATVEKGKALMAMYQERGIGRDRILLKIASTWEGLEAARILESEGYHVNMTLLFSLVQAHMAGEVKATLISPFAGRITDFYKTKEGRKENYPPESDPGVKSVKEIYHYMKANGYATVVMGASFRTKDQVIALAGCDLLTVSPSLLEELKNSHEDVPRVLHPDDPCPISRLGRKTGGDKFDASQPVDRDTFQWLMCEDEMATNKLTEGIRRFAADLRKLEDIIRKELSH